MSEVVLLRVFQISEYRVTFSRECIFFNAHSDRLIICSYKILSSIFVPVESEKMGEFSKKK